MSTHSIEKNRDLANGGLGDFEAQPDRLAFRGLMLFVALFFLRPWDQVPALATVRPMLLMTFVTIGLYLRTRPNIQFMSVRPMRLLLAMQAIILFSVLFSYWPSKSFTEAIEYTKQIAFFVLIVNLVTTIDRLKRLAFILAGCGAVHGGFAILNYLKGVEVRLEGVADGYFGDPNDLALSLVLVLPLAWWVSSVSPGRWSKLAIQACMLLMVGGVIATQSRGGLMALLAAVGVMVLTQGRERIVALILTLAAAVVFSVSVLPSDVFNRYTTITQYQQDESAMTRIAVWKSGARMFSDHMFTGTGASTFEVVYGQRYLDRAFGSNVWRSAHNSYIQIAAELGIMGLLVWLAILASGFLTLWRSRRLLKNPEIQFSDDQQSLAKEFLGFNAALAASLVGFCVGAVFLSRGYDLLMMMLIALIAVCAHNSEALASEDLQAE